MANDRGNTGPGSTDIKAAGEIDLSQVAPVLDIINGLFCVHDAQGQIVYMNQKFKDLIGYSDTQPKGIKTEDLAMEHHQQMLQAGLHKRLEEGEESSWELPIRRLDGKELIVAARTSPLYQKGRLVGEILLYEDITERKQAEAELHKSHQHLRAIFNGTVKALAVTTEKRDQYTAGHQLRVAALASAMAREMSLGDRVVDDLRIAGTLHDIGKLYVPLDILSQPGPLTLIQREYVQIHPEAGYDILKSIPFDRPIAEMIRQHHERLDGSGYPRGLKGGEMLPEAKLLAVADVVEAISSHRPYRASLGMENALQEIQNNAGRLYDETAVKACLKLITENRFEFPSGF